MRLEITTKSEVVGKNGKAIPGLYAAGEVMGGVHGNNRLGGNSLLDCVVFGRVSGKACAEYMLGDRVTATDLERISGGGLSGGVQGSSLAGGSYEDDMNQKKGGAAKPAAAAAAVAAPAGHWAQCVAHHKLRIGDRHSGTRDPVWAAGCRPGLPLLRARYRSVL